jgi:hypothetical protein
VVFTDLDRFARAMKDQTGDIESARWAFYEGRWGFVAPGYGVMGVSTLTVRHEDRPDVSYDWELGTVQSGGTSYRWEGYLLLRARNLGFIGPALRAAYLPRQRVRGAPTVGEFVIVVPEGSACQMTQGIPCERGYEGEVHYGVLAGLRPNWGEGGNDTLLFRAFATWGLENRLFGTQVFQQPLQILVAYMAHLDLSGEGGS